MNYCFSCFSIAAITSFESGVTSGSKRCNHVAIAVYQELGDV